MPSDKKPNKPMPSVAEINAYLELSAARTKKRLTLAMGQKSLTPPSIERTLKVQPKKTTEANAPSPKTPSEASVDSKASKNEDWSPFSPEPKP